MADKNGAFTNSALHPEVKEYAEARRAQRALLERPSISIRARIIGIFISLFILMSVITIAAIVLISEFRIKLQLLETIGNYSSEVQQARRFEKNFFLYRADLSDALANIHTAHDNLVQNAKDTKSVVGEERFLKMENRLFSYEKLLEELYALSDEKPLPKEELSQIEIRLRKYGALILNDAQNIMNREQLAIHSMLGTSTLVAVGFLILMFFTMTYVTGYIVRAVLKPLKRFVNYTNRIGTGDYSPIMPARKYRDEFSNLAIAINQMLSELKVHQEQLMQSGKMAAIGNLTSGIAHELNNPLNNIGITTESLLDNFADYKDEEKTRMLEQIYTQVERASGTVKNLLDFTRKDQPAFTSVSIRQIVESTIKLISNELNIDEIESSINLAEELPEIWGNPRSLQQVFLNLFLNSIQAMQNGGKLTVQAQVDQGFVRVDVTDTGIGIPKEHINMLFDPFFTTKEAGQGTGLGLSVSYGIIEKHKGKMKVESNQGKGTTFSVFLPIRENG